MNISRFSMVPILDYFMLLFLIFLLMFLKK